MGLFSNKKKTCPICGNPTPRLFAQKFDDQPICKECEDKLDLPKEILDNMTLYDFRQYLAVYEENEALRSIFNATYSHGGSLFSKELLMLDEENGLIRLKNTKSSWAIEKQYLKSFRIFEDNNLLYESGEGTLNSYPSEIPARAKALELVVNAFYTEKREYERREQLERMRSINETDEQRRERERVNRMYCPHFEDPKLFEGFRIEITLDHPYWTLYEETSGAPTFDNWIPSIDNYLKSYQERVDDLHLLAIKLMHMIDPNAGETQIGSATVPTGNAAAVVPVDAVAEIKKYKDLLDQGVITEEEFTAKKRNLLGI